jgi:Effector-associated domain 2
VNPEFEYKRELLEVFQSLECMRSRRGRDALLAELERELGHLLRFRRHDEARYDIWGLLGACRASPVPDALGRLATILRGLQEETRAVIRLVALVGRTPPGPPPAPPEATGGGHDRARYRQSVGVGPCWPVGRSARAMVAIAVQVLPVAERSRWSEEFKAELSDLRNWRRVAHAVRLLSQAVNLRHGLRRKRAGGSPAIGG